MAGGRAAHRAMERRRRGRWHRRIPTDYAGGTGRDTAARHYRAHDSCRYPALGGRPARLERAIGLPLRAESRQLPDACGSCQVGQTEPMRMADAEKKFEEYLTERASDLTAVTGANAVELMIGWYETQRVDDVSIHSGDMLLFQWGTYDWGNGPFFEYDITRQLIGQDQEDDDIWQLSLTVHAASTPKAKAVGAGNRWCAGLADLAEMRDFISRSPATEFIRTATVTGIELHYHCAG
jgi:hypothetical protein